VKLLAKKLQEAESLTLRDFIVCLPDCCWLQVRKNPEGPATDRPAISIPVGFLGRAGFVLQHMLRCKLLLLASQAALNI
jgi:hypothetical protein